MRGALALLLAGALAACAAAAPEAPVAVDVPAAWTADPGTAPTSAVPADGRWWAAFGSAELERLVARAIEANADLAASRERVAQAAARVRAAGAALAPALDAAAGASRDWRGGGRPADGFRAALDASYEVDLWGLGRAGVRAGEARLLASGFDRRALELGLAAEVATAYFQHLSLSDRLGRERRLLATAERVLDLVETKARLGAASGLELAQQRAAVASIRASIPELARLQAETANGLALLLGAPAGTVAVEGGTLAAVAPPAVAPGLPSDLLLRRPDIRSAEAALAAARADVAAARAAMLPSIRLTGSAGYASDALSSLFSPAGFLAGLAAGIAAPVFDAGRLAAGRDEAEAGARELAEAYRGAVLASFRDVEDALAATRLLAEAEAAQRVAAEEARTAFGLAETRYRAGAVDFLSVLETQQSLLRQEEALDRIALSRLLAAVGLYKALGGGW